MLCFVAVLLAMSVKVFSTTDSISSQKACPIVRIEAEQLPDLNIPRSGHSAFVANGSPKPQNRLRNHKKRRRNLVFHQLLRIFAPQKSS